APAEWAILTRLLFCGGGRAAVACREGVDRCDRRDGRAHPLSAPARPAGLLAELDALGQGQVARVVDGVGRAAHVVAPRVRARFATAAGFLFAAERAADFGARG